MASGVAGVSSCFLRRCVVTRRASAASIALAVIVPVLLTAAPLGGAGTAAARVDCKDVFVLAVPGTWETNAKARRDVVPGMLSKVTNPVRAAVERGTPIVGPTAAPVQIGQEPNGAPSSGGAVSSLVGGLLDTAGQMSSQSSPTLPDGQQLPGTTLPTTGALPTLQPASNGASVKPRIQLVDDTPTTSAPAPDDEDSDSLAPSGTASIDGGAIAWVVGIISTAAWGLGYFGQPHIIVRFMALRTPAEAKIGRRVGTTWMIITALGAVGTALIGIAYFAGDPAKPIEDPETVFLLLSQIFFHPLIAGLVLAAVLAAIMSTMSSQLVVCSSALVEDLVNLTGRKASPERLLAYGRLGVLAVALVAFVLALDSDSAILELVAFAWAGFGAAFGPIVLLSLYWRRLTAMGALAGMITGAVVVFVWGNIDALSDEMYEIVPGFLAALLVAVVVSRLTATDQPGVDEEFDQMMVELDRPRVTV